MVLLFGGALALGAMNQAYGDMSFNSGSLASVERKCTRMMSGSGYTDASSKAVCSCLVDKASNWRDRNPEAEYTEEIHTNFATVCVNSVGLARKSGASGSSIDQSDWGGDGFAADESEWVE